MYVEGIFLENTKMTKINCSFNHFTILNLISALVCLVFFFFFFFFFGGGGGGGGKVFISASWEILQAFYHLLKFSKLTFPKYSFRNTIRVSKQFGPRSGPTSCRA